MVTVWSEVRREERGLVLRVQGRWRMKGQFSNSRREFGRYPGNILNTNE